ncbi:MAG: hypothetical protein K2J64_03375 [Desulfovibrio sp.]|nr:hypothetical protein [Desulfovibrio sp.]
MTTPLLVFMPPASGRILLGFVVNLRSGDAAQLLLPRNAEIIRQKQPFRFRLRQKKISSVEYLSTLPSEIVFFLAGT